MGGQHMTLVSFLSPISFSPTAGFIKSLVIRIKIFAKTIKNHPALSAPECESQTASRDVLRLAGSATSDRRAHLRTHNLTLPVDTGWALRRLSLPPTP